jgi:ABC-type molybdate transport system substrate-binding protein
MFKLYGSGARIRRINQQGRVDAFLEDAERLLIDIVEKHKRDGGIMYHRGQIALRHIASARHCNKGEDQQL